MNTPVQTEELECIEGGSACDGPVEMRYPGYGMKTFPRCEKHGHDRLARQELIEQRYPVLQPSDFDPADAGESWDGD